MMYVVCGPPGSGKSTYVNQARQPGDLVWDFDAIADTLARTPTHPRPPHVTSCVYALRGTFLRYLAASPDLTAYVIITDPDEARRVAQAHHARLTNVDDPR